MNKKQQCGVKPYKISTIVDLTKRIEKMCFGVKPYIISTIVDIRRMPSACSTV